jgi:hypothetical protein
VSSTAPVREADRPDRATIETLCLVWLVSEQPRSVEEVTAMLGLDQRLSSAVASAYVPLVARGLVARDVALVATAEGVHWLNTELQRFRVVGV